MSDSPQNPVTKTDFFGQILVKRSVITEEQLSQALETQKKEPGFLGEILVKLGFIEERDIVVALVVQCSLPYIAVSKYTIDASILKLIPEEMVRKNFVVPLDKVGKVLSVVMADPLDETLKQEIQNITQCKVAPFIATKAEIIETINHWYGKKN